MREDREHRARSPRQEHNERAKTRDTKVVHMEVEEEGQENRKRTDRFRSERFDDNSKPTAEFGKGRYFSPKEGRGNRTWRDDRGNGVRGGGNEGPRERDFNRFRGADSGMRGRRDYSSQRLFESLTDPTEVPKLGSFFEVHVHVHVCT